MSSIKGNYYNVEDLYSTEKEKNSFEYLQDSVDFYIASLVHEKVRIKLARNLYEGVRDPKEFRYLEETFGIETPLAMKMTPLIKTRIDVLLGLLLDEVFTYRVTINDANTISTIENQKKSEKIKRITEGYEKQLSLNNSRLKQGQEPQQDVVTKRYMDRLVKSIDEDFVSEFEIAAQSLIKFFEQDNTIDLKQKVKQYFLDLLIAGEAYYRTHVDRIGEDPILTIVKPENLFYSKNTQHQYISSGHRPNVYSIVNREYMKRSDILQTYGHKMNDEAKKSIFGDFAEGSGRRIHDPRRLDQLHYDNVGNLNDQRGNGNQFTNSNMDTLPVYHVEWLANNKVELTDDEYREGAQDVEDITSRSKDNNDEDLYGKDAGSGKIKKCVYRLDRYEGIRIGTDIYINLGRSKRAPRSAGAPWLTTLSYNGIVYNDRNGTPYSVALSLKDLQDSFDIVMFYRDNMIASSGLDGSRINMAAIPKVLGQNYMERILKFIAFRKQGLEFYDPTEDGANLWSGYGDFKGSLSSGALQDLNLVLESIQAQADVVTGINRHMYAAAEIKDAVSNVQRGEKQVSLITKDIFELVHTGHIHILTDLINRAKTTYKKGKRATYILGDRTLLMDLQEENFCFTDYNIHVVNSTKENAKLERLVTAIPDLVAANILDADVLVNVIMSDSPTEIRRLVDNNMAKKKEENDQLSQMQQQVEQASQQAQELDKQLQEISKQNEALSKASDAIREREVAAKEASVFAKNDDMEGRLTLDTQKNAEEVKKDRELIQLEREQLYLETGDGNSKEIRNNI